MAALYPNHIPISKLSRILLAGSSAVAALRNPYRDDMVAVCSETTACNALEHMRGRMLDDETGRRILNEQPRVNSSTIDLKLLRALPESTLGRQYVNMLNKYNITPDSRRDVKFVDDPELAFVLQRYRETHDFNHLLLGQRTNLRGEVAVKWFEAIQTSLPMCWMAAVGGTTRLSRKRRLRLLQHDLPWIIPTAKSCQFFMNIYFEERLDQDIDDLRNEMKIYLPRS
ncbi:ubiquinone biosynthesis protein COQ4 homolog, mitochondrial-like [Ciona intestinalis]